MESTSSPPTSPSPSEAEETASTDTEASPAPLDHDDAALSDHPRLLACMRALLTGSIIALIAAVALALVRGDRASVRRLAGARTLEEEAAQPSTSKRERLDDHDYVEQSREIVDHVRGAVASAMRKKRRKGKERAA